jgi:hypothetical protein
MIREQNLIIYHLDNGTWTPLQTTVNGTENFAFAYPPHFSTFTLGGTPTISPFIIHISPFLALPELLLSPPTHHLMHLRDDADIREMRQGYILKLLKESKRDICISWLDDKRNIRVYIAYQPSCIS